MTGIVQWLLDLLGIGPTKRVHEAEERLLRAIEDLQRELRRES